MILSWGKVWIHWSYTNLIEQVKVSKTDNPLKVQCISTQTAYIQYHTQTN